MYSTTVYLYQQKQTVLIVDTSGAYFDRRWQPVYSKKLKISRGVDNVILFEFINQDQKPVNISGRTITFRVFSEEASAHSILRKDLEILNAAAGRAKVTITEEDLDAEDAQVADWSLETSNGDLWQGVFVDDYAGTRGQIEIQSGVYPEFVASGHLHIPSYQPQEISSKNRVHTSIINRNGFELTTFQLDFDNFTGNIKAQGSDTQLGPWYDIGRQVSYVNQDTRAYINVAGAYTWLRFEINQYGVGATGTAEISNGTVSSVSIASGGRDYLGTGSPNVEIEGLGTGAGATATTSANSVAGLSLIGGGEGYVQVPDVKINQGLITLIKYR